MGQRIGRGKKRLRERERQERQQTRAALAARTLELREKNRLADAAAAAANEERAAKEKEAREKAKKLSDRLAELGYKISPARYLFHYTPPDLFVIDGAVLEKLIAALESLPRDAAVGKPG